MMRTVLRCSRLLILCGLMCMLHAAAYAQFSGTISGVVADPTGAIVPGATLSLRNTATNVQRTTKSTSAGVYQFVSLALVPTNSRPR